MTTISVGSPRHLPADSRRLVVGALGVVYIGAAIFCFAQCFLAEKFSEIQLNLACSAFSIYLYLESRRLILSSDSLSALSPAVLSSFFVFFASYTLQSSVMIFDEKFRMDYMFLFYDFYESFLYSIFICFGACFVMWRGYYIGSKIASGLRNSLIQSQFIRKNLHPNMISIFFLQLIYIFGVLYSIKNGIFGFSANKIRIEENVSAMEFLNLAIGAGTFALFLLALSYFQLRKSGGKAAAMGAMTLVMAAVMVCVGAFSGFKSQLAVPFIVIAAAAFVVLKRIKYQYIIYGILALIVAYSIIEPFRSYLGRNPNVQPDSVSEMVDVLQKSYGERDRYQRAETPVLLSITSRLDVLGQTAVAIDYVDAGRLDPTIAEWMAEAIYLSPILAFLPRAFWPDKPSYSTGVWFNQHVRGSWYDSRTAVGMGPVAYLYLVGGLTGVLLGFFCIGILQAVIFEGVGRAGPGGLIVYFSVAMPLALLPTDLGVVLTSLIRMLPIAFLAQYFVLLPGRTRLSPTPPRQAPR
ncbi:hypothetical protein [Aquabacter spiritensis]|nr:hypothetical protein [Aquabacter spiritensis]